MSDFNLAGLGRSFSNGLMWHIPKSGMRVIVRFWKEKLSRVNFGDISSPVVKSIQVVNILAYQVKVILNFRAMNIFVFWHHEGHSIFLLTYFDRFIKARSSFFYTHFEFNFDCLWVRKACQKRACNKFQLYCTYLIINSKTLEQTTECKPRNKNRTEKLDSSIFFQTNFLNYKLLV